MMLGVALWLRKAQYIKGSVIPQAIRRMPKLPVAARLAADAELPPGEGVPHHVGGVQHSHVASKRMIEVQLVSGSSHMISLVG